MQSLTSNQQTKEALPCLLIPMQGGRIVLPNVTMAELIPYQTPQATTTEVEWIVGAIEWRGTMIPIISYESFCGQRTGPQGQDLRVAVVNAPNGETGGLRFFGLITQGIPSLIKLEEAAIKENHNGNLLKGQKMAVTLETGHAIIPDLDMIEQAILKEKWQ
ncbi:MAG: chemosensory pili system protein ChpC [Oceanicoccus sp.]|jgi:chemosensory pili system protein ChpC